LLPLSQPYPWAATVLVDEVDAGGSNKNARVWMTDFKRYFRREHRGLDGRLQTAES